MESNVLAVFNKALRLADQPEEKQTRTKRLTDLLRPSDAEETASWFMCVPSCFNNAIDIKLTPRKEKGEVILVWTQGSAFQFQSGDVIYDTPMAYAAWGEALGQFRLCVKVNQAIGAAPEKKGAKAKEVTPRNPGSVWFSVLTPDEQKKIIVGRGEFFLTQDDFVRFLIKGPEEDLAREFQAAQVAFRV